MRKFLLLLLFVCSNVWATVTFTNIEFGVNQVADTQWDTGNCLSSNTCTIYSKNVGGTYETGSWTPLTSGEYISFVASGNPTYPWQMNLYSSSGTLLADLGIGRILVQGTYNGNYYLFFTNQNYNGTLLSAQLGMSGSSGFTFAGTASPTVAQTNSAAASWTTTPLAPGQQATSQPTVVSTVNSTTITTTTSGATVYTYSQPITTTTYSDGSQTVANNGSATLISTTVTGTSGGITTGQQADVTVFNNNVINGSSVYIQQSGNNDVINIQQIGTHNLIGGIGTQFAQIQNGGNNITIKQGNGNAGQNEIDLSVAGGSNTLTITQANDTAGISAGSNYQLINVNGVGNNITATQTNDGGLVGHFAEINVTGSSDTVGLTQANNGQKQAFVTVVGNNNSVTASQSGLGQHYLSIGESGNGNSATVTQTGSTANSATITLINAGSPASVNLTQTGGQSYSISQSCVTNCGTVTVRQGN